MKLAKIKALCLEAGKFEIINAGRCQWIGNGNHWFRVFGARLQIGELDRLLGVKAQKAAECDWDAYDEDDAQWDDTFKDSEAQALPVADVWGYDQRLLALEAAGRMLYVRYDALDCMDPEARRTYTIRRVNGTAHVMCYTGMIADAILAPIADDDAQRLSGALCRVAEIPVYSNKDALYGAGGGGEPPQSGCA